ncbi:MAG: hypothetical protein HYR56_26980 [Acidobacteria bacterium]|nr:hypothetical protein [Acidobacteriota bacterium]MBI3427695.1 hypothetical protein [Acidobacteriota bacterium]
MKFVYLASLWLVLMVGQVLAQIPAASPSPTPAPGKAQAKPTLASLARWFEVQTATITPRYRWVENSARLTTSNHAQYQDSFKGRLKFDARGRYSLNAGVFSGAGFTQSWDDTGWGTGHATSNLYLKQLYFSAQPVKGVELQIGGLYFNRGESTEITTYDNDGYLVGERLSLKRPRQLFFDEVAVTYAYLGDLTRANLNKRYHRLQQSNYHQFLVSKSLGKRAAVSVDYSFHNGVETLREAVKLNTPELKVLDAVRWENYERLDVNRAYGFALTGEKKAGAQLTLTGGYGHIDRRYDGLNADRFNRGHRLFTLVSYALSPEFTVSTFLARAVGNDYALPNRTRFEVLCSFNLLKGLQRAGIL